jgi:uncharacterized membrane protein YbhN (UPF0104 family)
MTKNLLNKIINLITLICLVIGFYYVLHSADWSKLKHIKEHISYFGIFLVFSLIISAFLLMFVRFYILIIPVKKDIKLKNIVQISIHAMILNSTTPGKVGYPLKAYLLKKKEELAISRSLPSIFSEIFLDYLLTAVFFVISIFIGGFYPFISRVFSSYLIPSNFYRIILLLTVLFIVVFSLKRKIFSSDKLKNTFKSIKLISTRNDVIFMSIILTVFYISLQFYADYILIRSLGFKVPISFIVFTSSFSNLLVLLAPLPGGLGVRELSGAYLFQVFYNLGEIAIVAVLISRILTFATLFILFLLTNSVQFVRKRKDTKGMEIALKNDMTV